jgi:hypothetical protein
MLSAMPHTAISPFPRSNPDAITPIGQASRGTTYQTSHGLLLAVRRPRVCVVYRKAHYWLRQPTDRLQAHLASELGVDVAAPPSAAEPKTTEAHHHPGVAR